MPASQFMADLRFGTVDSVQADAHAVTVKLEDPDLTVEAIRMPVQRPGDYWLPPKGTPVAVLLMKSRLGNGVIVGCFYTDSNTPPLNDADQRAIASDDLRLGEATGTSKVSLAPKCKQNLDDQKTHFDAVEAVLTGPTINEPGNGGPSALQIALKAAILGSPYPTPQDPAAEKVGAK